MLPCTVLAWQQLLPHLELLLVHIYSINMPYALSVLGRSLQNQGKCDAAAYLHVCLSLAGRVSANICCLTHHFMYHFNVPAKQLAGKLTDQLLSQSCRPSVSCFTH